MARTAGNKEVAVVESKSAVAVMGDAPDYLPANVKNLGTEALDRDDVKTPRIVLLQALSPQIRSFPGVAIPGHFWHTGMNISLGNTFNFIPALVGKRVILFRPRDDNDGGILAFSRDAKTWQTGANQKFKVQIKNKEEPVIWETGKDVESSGLAEWGSMNPDDAHSPPAATLIYEYLCYLVDRPELSPCVLGVSKTGIPIAKNFNTSLLMITRTGKPTACVKVRAFAEEQSSGSNHWTVANFVLDQGWASKEQYNAAKMLADQYADYQVEYQPEDVSDAADEKAF